MTRLLLFCSIGLLASCATSPVQYRTFPGAGSCLVNAVGFRDAYNAQQSFSPSRWSRVLILTWDARRAHAVCVYEFAGQIWVYDNASLGGSRPLTADMTFKGSPLGLAHLARPLDLVADAQLIDAL